MRDIEGSVNDLLGIFDRGRTIHKTADDLLRYESIIETVKPQIVVETGLLYAGSACWFAERVPRVICIELHGKHVTEFLAGEYGPVPANVTVVHGNSLGDDTTQRVINEVADAAPVLVVLDSDHGTETVLGELRRYARLATVGSYCVAEDGILAHYSGNWFPGSPLEAIDRFLAEDDGFEIDMELEDRYPRTQHPNGFLRRVR